MNTTRTTAADLIASLGTYINHKGKVCVLVDMPRRRRHRDIPLKVMQEMARHEAGHPDASCSFTYSIDNKTDEQRILVMADNALDAMEQWENDRAEDRARRD